MKPLSNSFETNQLARFLEQVDIIHFVGVGGIGMSALAQYLLSRGKRVTGSDLYASEITEGLQRRGAQITIGHSPENVADAQLVVVTAAIPEDNLEVLSARGRGIPLVTRAQLLGAIMHSHKGIAVTGTHGKTTTTAMLGYLLHREGWDPTIFVGGEVSQWGGNCRIGQSEWLVTEACEAYDSFLQLHPYLAVITNIEPDHLDYYQDFLHLLKSFKQFIAQVSPEGGIVACGDDPSLRDLLKEASVPVLYYGFSEDNDLRPGLIRTAPWSVQYDLYYHNQRITEVKLSLSGRHNVLNSLAALGAGYVLGIPFPRSALQIADFQGVARRFEKLTEVGGILVIDDYAHHPTEIRATLQTALGSLQPKRLLAIFQPHLYSRTRDFLRDFARELALADVVILTDIYPAREKPIPGVTGEILAEEVRRIAPSKEVRFISPKEEIPCTLLPDLRPGDLVLILGAGNIRQVGETLSHLLWERYSSSLIRR